MACRLPGPASSPDEFWDLLMGGRDAITDIPADRLELAGAYHPDPARSGRHYARRGGFLPDVAGFDPQFFAMSGREADRVDPQHRLLLEMTYEAFEDAGIPVESVAGSPTGVFIGISQSDYANVAYYPANSSRIDGHANSGAATSMAANRISFCFDLHGPSFIVDTACSSSLTAVHVAVAAWRRGECSIAVVGGIQLMLVPELTIGFSKAHMLSPHCRCAAFDAGADGYVRSEGGAVVILKPLDVAVLDGDHIYAVAAGSAINEDGRTTGITVPSAAAQQAVIRAALADAEINPIDVSYVEAHGTGTPVGDPIEAAALGAVFAPGRSPDECCPIGSVKTNIGHLEAASGIAGLCKVALSLSHRQLPKSLHYSAPNPAIDFPALRLRVLTEHEPWSTGRPLIAGVNSFGFGGANAHVVLVGPPATTAQPLSPPGQQPGEALPLVVSARSETALLANAEAIADHLAGSSPDSLSEVCRTAALRRSHHDYRLAAVASTRAEMAELLRAAAAGERRAATATGRRNSPPLQVAFVFSGMGPQWWGMARQLMATEPIFDQKVRECDAALTALAPGRSSTSCRATRPPRASPNLTSPTSPTSRCKSPWLRCGNSGGSDPARSSATAAARWPQPTPRAR